MAWLYERHSHFRSFDVMLQGRADSLLGSVQDAGDAADNVMLDKSDLSIPEEDIYEVRDASGRLLGRSPNWDGATEQIFSSHSDKAFPIFLNGKEYRALLLKGLRVVDPDEKGGGVPRHVTIVYGSPTKHLWHAVMGTVKFYAVSSLILLAITGIIMAWLLNRGLAPLRELAAEASKVSVNSWEFTPSEQARSTKELAPLVEALEAALQRLERSFMQQRRFVSDSAHELKTGVAVVKSSLQLLAMKPRTAAEYQAGLERCEADCARMEELVTRMLTLARVEASASEAAHVASESNVSLVLRQICEQLQPVAELRRIGVVLSLPESFSESLYVHLAQEECGLLFSNLLLNALQHSGPDTTITVSAHTAANTAEIHIADQGAGINPEALPHVFEPFYRDDPSRNRNTGGTGLGLSICKAIVDAAGGEIAISSYLNVGTTVMVRLPLAPASTNLKQEIIVSQTA
jgi:signal transduction histidine kinase